MIELPYTELIKIAKLETFLLRTEIDEPVITSFGTISERTVLLIRVEDCDGAFGWGEVFGNFPTHGAENRQHLIHDYITPLAFSETWNSPLHAFETITAKTHVLSLQSGEAGPFAQSIAGLDIALWDLWKLMGGDFGSVPTYGSGLNPAGFEEIVENKITEGYNAFKIKVGFERLADLTTLSNIRKIIGDKILMVDVNQGWDIDTAIDNWSAYSEFNLNWIEEPIPADRPLTEWRHLASQEGSTQIRIGTFLYGKRKNT